MAVETKSKTITKIDENTFNLKEERVVSEDINIIDRLQFLTSIGNQCRNIITESVKNKENLLKNIEYYNFRVDIINEAIDNGLDYPKQERIEVKEDFHIDDMENVKIFPKVEISKEKQE